MLAVLKRALLVHSVVVRVCKSSIHSAAQGHTIFASLLRALLVPAHMLSSPALLVEPCHQACNLLTPLYLECTVLHTGCAVSRVDGATAIRVPHIRGPGYTASPGHLDWTHMVRRPHRADDAADPAAAVRHIAPLTGRPHLLSSKTLITLLSPLQIDEHAGFLPATTRPTELGCHEYHPLDLHGKSKLIQLLTF